MVKKHTTLSIESDILEMAKARGINLSETAEEALRRKLEIKEVEIAFEISNCEFCGKEFEKATPENPKGLTWLFPDEKWICPNCLDLEATRRKG